MKNNIRSLSDISGEDYEKESLFLILRKIIFGDNVNNTGILKQIGCRKVNNFCNLNSKVAS